MEKLKHTLWTSKWKIRYITINDYPKYRKKIKKQVNIQKWCMKYVQAVVTCPGIKPENPVDDELTA